MPFDVDKYLDETERTFFSEFGWPDSGDGADESYTPEEGEGEAW